MIFESITDDFTGRLMLENQLIGFLFFGACSHVEIARENIASVLAQRVKDGLCDIDEAEICARRLFYDNPWNTFAFENWKGKDPQ